MVVRSPACFQRESLSCGGARIRACPDGRRGKILVSDDGSTDGSVEIIEAYLQRGQIIATDGPRLRNWVANSNKAVERASGRIVTFLHQDDIWLPGRLERLHKACAESPGGTLWLSPTRFLDSEGRIVGTWSLPIAAKVDAITPAILVERLLVQNFIGMPAPAFSRAEFLSSGGMDESLWYTADWDLWIRLGSEGVTLIDHQPTTGFRLHRESQTMAGVEVAESIRTQSEVVRNRHLWRIDGSANRQAVDRAGRFAVELNAGLACVVAGQPVRWRQLGTSLAHLGPGGLASFARNARILERIAARLRAFSFIR